MSEIFGTLDSSTVQRYQGTTSTRQCFFHCPIHSPWCDHQFNKRSRPVKCRLPSELSHANCQQSANLFSIVDWMPDDVWKMTYAIKNASSLARKTKDEAAERTQNTSAAHATVTLHQNSAVRRDETKLENHEHATLQSNRTSSSSLLIIVTRRHGRRKKKKQHLSSMHRRSKVRMINASIRWTSMWRESMAHVSVYIKQT